jgi:hypothetical protein
VSGEYPSLLFIPTHPQLLFRVVKVVEAVVEPETLGIVARADLSSPSQRRWQIPPLLMSRPLRTTPRPHRSSGGYRRPHL